MSTSQHISFKLERIDDVVEVITRIKECEIYVMLLFMHQQKYYLGDLGLDTSALLKRNVEIVMENLQK